MEAQLFDFPKLEITNKIRLIEYNDRQFLEGRQPNSICPSFVLYLFMFVIPCVIDVYVANKILSRITDFKQYLFYFGQ